MKMTINKLVLDSVKVKLYTQKGIYVKLLKYKMTTTESLSIK